MPRSLLDKRLEPALEAAREERRTRATLIASGIVIASGLVLWAALARQESPLSGTAVAWTALAVTWIVLARRRAGRAAVDPKTVARRIEARFPELHGRLFTALDLADGEEHSPRYLEERVLGETLGHSVEHDWAEAVRGPRPWRWTVAQGAAWFGIALLAVHLQSIDSPMREPAGAEMAASSGELVPIPVDVTPGNTEVEKGTRLIVEARFPGEVPEAARLELLDPVTGEPTELFPMRRNLEDPTFAAVVPAVTRSLGYRVVHESGGSETFSVGVYELPKLERADVTVTPPAYAGTEPVTLRDVRKVTALEGSDLAFTLTVNQPVAAAELFGEDGSVIPLVPVPGEERLLTASVRPEADRKYRVHLVDAADRANADPPWLTVKLKRNEPPKLELAFPGRDTEVSALEEVALEGKVSDDLGLARVGATVTVGDRTETILLSDGALPGRESHRLSALFPLEEHGAVPNQLVSYHLWAEDIGPDGQPRRTESDLFFAEVRDWEHIYREGVRQGEPPPGEGEGNQSAELREQQKEVMNATWKVAREVAAAPGGIASRLADVRVLREGQDLVGRNVDTVLEEAEDPALRKALESARAKMTEAVSFLGWAEEKTDAGVLADALAAEREAYQHLLAAEARETQVTRQQNPSSSRSNASAQQRRLMQLDLKEDEDRYETERQARPEEEKTGQQEELDILARLRELARRQEALAEAIQELQAALQAAATEKEREDLERRLERLQEEQEQLLRDVDDLGERMDESQNAERLDQERQQLSEAREQAREAGEQLDQQELGAAANSARRAKEELAEAGEQLRERTGQRFAQEVQELRQEVRALGEAEDQLGEKLDRAPARSLGFPAPTAPGTGTDEEPFDRQELAAGLSEQKERLEAFLERMREVSEQAEESEPTLSDTLYDAARQAQAENPVESLDQASRLSRYGAIAEAHERERAAARALDDLREGVEQAAEQVLGSESEALRQARQELDRLIETVQKEAPDSLAQAAPGQGKPPSQTESESPTPAESPGQGKKLGQSEAQAQADSPGQGKSPGQSEAQAQADSPGQGKSPGLSESQAQADSQGQGKSPGQSASQAQAQAQSGPPSGEPSGPGRGAGSDQPFFEDTPAPDNPAPLSGDGYERFAEGLRRVEGMLGDPSLQADAARVLDRARSMRHAYRGEREAAPPQWDLVRTQVMEPLVELRRHVAEALARVEQDHPLVPVDRDPVPAPYRELVRRYYEELAKGN